LRRINVMGNKKSSGVGKKVISGVQGTPVGHRKVFQGDFTFFLLSNYIHSQQFCIN